MKIKLYKLPIIISLLFTSSYALSQKKSADTKSASVKYVSSLDQGLNINQIMIAPLADNVSDIYSVPLQELAEKNLADKHQWEVIKSTDGLKTIEQLIEKPEKLSKYLAEKKSDALFFSRIKKTTTGVSFILQLYLRYDGNLLLEDSSAEFPIFELDLVKSEYLKSLNNFFSKLPYDGVVLSRRGQQVTINLGSKHGLIPQTEVEVIQILKVNRHPKLSFMVGNEKEILGKIIITKTDDYLSFGQITFEKEPGVIAVNNKIAPISGIHYPKPTFDPEKNTLTNLEKRSDSELAFGKDPKEWLPLEPPQYGSFSLLGGFNQYSENSTLVSAGNIEAKQSLAPTLRAEFQLWLSPDWIIQLNTQQSVFNASNQLTGSSPSSLTFMLSSYNVVVGHNFLLTGDFFGPKIQVNGGIWRFSSRPDSSSPTAFTTMNYGGFTLGVLGSFPIDPNVPVELGAEFNLFFFPSVTESPEDSGSPGGYSLNHFAFFFKNHINKRFNFIGNLSFDYYASDFTGTASRVDPANSISHKMTSLLLGAEYLF